MVLAGGDGGVTAPVPRRFFQVVSRQGLIAVFVIGGCDLFGVIKSQQSKGLDIAQGQAQLLAALSLQQGEVLQNEFRVSPDLIGYFCASGRPFRICSARVRFIYKVKIFYS